MSSQEELLGSFASRGRSLESLGLQELAWTRTEAIEILAHLAEKEIAVLGGDVYRETPDGLQPTYENWYCEREPGEGFQEFLKRSRKKAATFLSTYPDSSAAFFVLVLSEI